MKTIAIIDYGMGNLHSVKKAVEHVIDANTQVIITQSATQIKTADKVILPGQGAIAGCMQHIEQYELKSAIQDAAQNKPFLAICVGPQLLMESSEENGGTNGFGIFSGTCKRFSDALTQQNPPLKIPHMGWNTVKQTNSHPLWANIDDNSYFYFVHSYYLCPKNNSDVLGMCDYGHTFASALAKDNLFTTQCHPEKSANAGIQLFKNFVGWSI